MDRIRLEFGEETAELWFKPVQPARLENDILYVKVPNRFFSDGIRERYQKRLAAVLKEISGRNLGLEYEVEKDLKNILTHADPLPPPVPQSDFSLGTLNPRYTFSSFVVGASNRFAHATAESISKSPGTQYNPYFIYGGVGLGKTHLMHSLGNALRREQPKARVLYTTSEQFVNEFIKSIGDNRTEDFRSKYRHLDCLLIDDIQFLIGKHSSEQEFFHTFNALFETRKQIVISSDRSPKDMSPSEQRLISRFEWGVVADVRPPDLETRIAILRKKAAAEQLDIPDDVILFVAAAIKTNIRELEGALIRLKAFSSMSGAVLTVDSAKEILHDCLSQEGSSPVRIETIQKVVAQKYSVDVKDLKSHQRSASVVLPRQLAMYLACTMTELSYADVGKAFGGKDHSTVHHAKGKILKKIEQDPFTAETINRLQAEIRTLENK